MAEARWKNITEALEGQILSGGLKPGDRVPSEEEIATAHGVSRPTAHRALRELQTRGLVTRQRRWGTVVAERQSLKTKRIGLIVDVVDESYGFPQPGLLRGIQAGLSDEYSLVLCDSQNDPQREAELIRKMRDESDGIVLLPINSAENTPLLKSIAASGFPLVMLDRVPEGVDVPVALSDNYATTLSAIETLTGQGHRKIGFLSFYKPHVSTVQDRYRAYQDALKAVGEPESEDYVRFLSWELEHSHDRRFAQAVQDAVVYMLNAEEPLTALFCVQDMFVPIVMEACEKAGRRVPEDVALVTFNDGPAMVLRKPWAVHRIVPRVFEIGRVAGEALLRAMLGSPYPAQMLQIHADFHPADSGVVSPDKPQSLIK